MALTQCPHFRTEKTSSNFLQVLETIASSDTNYFVWKQLFSSLKSLCRAWSSEENLHNALLAFQRDFTKVGFQHIHMNGGIAFEDDDSTLFKALLFNAAGEADEPSVIESAKSQYRDFMNGRAISEDTRDSVFAIAIRHGTDREFSCLLNLYISPSRGCLLRSKLLSALGHTQDSDNLQKILDLWLRASYQESGPFSNALESMSLYPKSAVLTWEFVKAHFEILADRTSTALKQNLWFIKWVLRSLSMREQFDDVKGFFQGRNLTLSCCPWHQGFLSTYFKVCFLLRFL